MVQSSVRNESLSQIQERARSPKLFRAIAVGSYYITNNIIMKVTHAFRLQRRRYGVGIKERESQPSSFRCPSRWEQRLCAPGKFAAVILRETG